MIKKSLILLAIILLSVSVASAVLVSDEPYGTYEVVRQIDIDPPVNGVQTWINYGRELIGSISVTNPVQAESETTQPSSSTVDAKAPILPRWNQITGNVIEGVGGTGSVPMLIGLSIICMTIVSSIYIRSRYK